MWSLSIGNEPVSLLWKKRLRRSWYLFDVVVRVEPRDRVCIRRACTSVIIPEDAVIRLSLVTGIWLCEKGMAGHCFHGQWVTPSSSKPYDSAVSVAAPGQGCGAEAPTNISVAPPNPRSDKVFTVINSKFPIMWVNFKAERTPECSKQPT